MIKYITLKKIFQPIAFLEWCRGMLPFMTSEEKIIFEYKKAFGESGGKKESPTKKEKVNGGGHK